MKDMEKIQRTLYFNRIMRSMSTLGQSLIDNGQYKDISPMELALYCASEVGNFGVLGTNDNEIDEIEKEVKLMCEDLKPYEDNIIAFPKDKEKK